MKRRSESIKSKLMRVILVTCSVVLFLTYTSYFIYEFFTFREITKNQISTLGKIIAANSTAALAFDSRNDANEILDALKAEKNIIAAALYDEKGNLFAKYPVGINNYMVPLKPGKESYHFKDYHLEGFQAVV